MIINLARKCSAEEDFSAEDQVRVRRTRQHRNDLRQPADVVPVAESRKDKY